MNLPDPSAAAVAALAPTGTLRAAINLGNFLLVTGKSTTGEPEGVSPDMARALADRLDVPVELLGYKSPAAVADDSTTGAWDVGNIGAEPQRAETIDFTDAYCEIEATYLVRGDSDITSIDDVDQPGRTVVCPARSAYGLWLERNITRAELIQVEGLRGALDAFIDNEIEVLAGLRAGLLSDVERVPGGRILDGRFTAVRQAMGTPKGRDEAGLAYLRRFVEAAKGSGMVADSISRHEVWGLSVAPPQAPEA